MYKLFNILYTSFTFTKYSNFLYLLTFILPEFFCATSQPNQLCYFHTLFNAPSNSPCLLYTLSISSIIICSTRYYRVMSAVVLSKESDPVTNANCSSQLVQAVFSSVSRLCSSYYRVRSMCNIEWFLRNSIQFRLMEQTYSQNV